MTTKTKTTVSAAIDAINEVASPLDFSFKALAELQDAMDEEPRPGPHKIEKIEESGHYKSNMVRFCYNAISDYECLPSTLEHFLENPLELAWLDLSFNDLSSIDKVLLQYPKLKILYLHSNAIEKLSEIDKLAALPELISITLHGNPIESIPGYKQHIISTLPKLKTLDFIPITNQNRRDAQTWRVKFRKK
ncbi:leucine-rich repeat-containing protein 51-like [Orbicella faveolata]|uniref:leucine-rich repeat-containing protein 51-like n=2 Tax=Orbicella faveolata TaxID=48498 RepID=UPI0009E1DEFE|nr:leucine-rich repeat-containing protein 51-like [Orbicella faveolata]